MKGTSEERSFDHPLLSESQSPEPPQYVFVLPPPNRRRLLRKSRHCTVCFISCVAVLIFLIAAVYLLWPSNPKLSVARVSLESVKFHVLPKLSIDLKLNLTVRVWNRDIYGVDYDSLNVSIGYKGETLGNVSSDGGHIKARRSSYVNTTLELDAVEILSNAVSLVEDWTNGEITFDTESRISGTIRVFFFDLPLKAKISCEETVDTRNETISRQNCFPE